MISYKNKLKKTWDMGVLLLAVFNSLQVPFEQSYHPEILQTEPF